MNFKNFFLFFQKMKIFIFFFFFKFSFFYVKFQIMLFFSIEKSKEFEKKVFCQIAKIAFFLYFFKKTWKKTEVGQLQTKTFCGKYLWVVSTSSKKFVFVELVKDMKKFSWNNKKQHQKVLFFKSPVYPLLVCLFLLSLSHEVSRVQP